MSTICRLLAAAVVVAVCWVAGCAKKSGREAVPEIPNTLTDTRDGKTYKTVTIGKQTWMAENLNYQPSSGNSWCYDNDPSHCNTYGRLYDWSTAMGGASSSTSNPSGVQGICPEHWHLPSRAEWDHLAEAVGGEKASNYGTWHDWLNAGEVLKSETGWNSNGNGTDSYGFSALPGGNRYSDDSCYYAGNYGDWWTATKYDGINAYSRYMHYNSVSVHEVADDKSYGFSVRCVMDKSALARLHKKTLAMIRLRLRWCL